MLKVAAIIAAVLALSSTAVYFAFSLNSDSDQASERTSLDGGTVGLLAGTELATNNEPSPPVKDYIRITAMGDMIPHDTVNLRAQVAGGYDYTQFFAAVRQYMTGDIVFCNQEVPSAGSAFAITGYPSFNAPIEFARDLNRVGCNMINLANNHIADKGQAGVNATLDAWGGLATLAVTGANRSQAEQDTISYFEVEDMTFAFIAFTDLTNNAAINPFTVNQFSDQLVDRLASAATANADYVIASAHWGNEDSEQVSATQRAWAQRLSENGVDLIIGTGPHVVQTVETLTNSAGDTTTVLYSLGNFLSTQLTIEQLTSGIVYIDVPTSPDQTVKLSFMPTFMSYTWSAAEQAAADYLKRDNLALYPLANASPQLEASLFSTTAQAQIDRLVALITSGGVPIEIISPL